MGHVRTHQIPKIVFTAQEYYEMIDWSAVNLTELPLMRNMCLEDLCNAVENPKEIENFFSFPSHTQAVERGVKIITEASAAVCGPAKRDKWIKTTIQSREKMPKFSSKKKIM